MAGRKNRPSAVSQWFAYLYDRALLHPGGRRPTGHAERYRKSLGNFSAAADQLLLRHPWPGNVRELDHTVERAVLMADSDQIEADDLGLVGLGCCDQLGDRIIVAKRLVPGSQWKLCSADCRYLDWLRRGHP